MSITDTNVSKRTQAKGEKALLEALAELAGGVVTERNIVREGDKIVIPPHVSLRQASKIILKAVEDDEQTASFSNVFDYRPWDGAYCMNQALIRAFGSAGFSQPQVSMFGVNPPAVIQVRIGKNEDGSDQTVSVPWGNFEFPLLSGGITTDTHRDPERGPLFEMTVSVPKKFEAQAKGMFKLVQVELENNSIYRGKAFDGAVQPSFINPYNVDRRTVIYTDLVQAQLEANMWAMLRHTSYFEEEKLPLKRAVLLEGPYGTGKTLAAKLTSQEAVENGWAFIQCRPGVDDLGFVLQTARLYQPAVVFFEDVDTIASSGDPEAVSRLLDMFDGISVKGTKLLMVLTTNHPERLMQAMQRPGRLDARIQIAALDGGAIERLIKANVAPSMLDANLDFTRIEEAMQGYLPAFITETIHRAKFYAIARAGYVDHLSTEDFVNAAAEVRPQYEAMQNASAAPTAPAFSVAMQHLVGEVVTKVVTDQLNKSVVTNQRGDDLPIRVSGS